MTAIKNNGKNGTAKLLKAGAAVIFLFFYLTGNLGQGLLHDLVHVHDEVTHTEKDELDACHRAIYHEEAEKTCGHESHLSAKVTCQICDLVSPTDQDVVSIASGSFEENEEAYLIFDFSSPFISVPADFPARAPPVLS